MSKKIVIVGACVASLASAAILASKGFDVTLYEKKEENSLGNDRAVSFDPDLLEINGISLPENDKWISCSPVSIYSPSLSSELHRHIPESRLDIKMIESDLIYHLLSHAKKSGAKIICGCEANSLIVFGERAVGIKTADGDVYADLVIDGAGYDSDLRHSLPGGTKTEKNISRKDLAYTYFARFSRPDDVLIRDKYRTVIFPGGSKMIARIESESDFTDVYLTYYEPVGKPQIDSDIEFIRGFNPSVGKDIICGGKVYKSPSRAPINIPVCDGYASLGAAAFAGRPLTGESTSEELMQSKLIAKNVCRDKKGVFDKESLWGYQSDYFIVAGKNIMAFSAVKNILLSLSAEEVDNIFEKKLITSKDMSFDVKKPFASFDVKFFSEKLHLLNDNPGLLKKLSQCLPQILKALALGETIPRKWNDYAVNLWLKGAKFFK